MNVTATLGGNMTARQMAESRVAAGIVLPQNYRGTSVTAQLAEDPLPNISSSTNPMRPTPPPPEAQPSARQVWRSLALALALALSVLTSVGPGLGESPRAQYEMKQSNRNCACLQDYQWVALDPEANRQFDLSVLGSQVEMEMDEVDISYDRLRLRIKYEEGRSGMILCLLPPDACTYSLEEGRKCRSQTNTTTRHYSR